MCVSSSARLDYDDDEIKVKSVAAKSSKGEGFQVFSLFNSFFPFFFISHFFNYSSWRGVWESYANDK